MRRFIAIWSAVALVAFAVAPARTSAEGETTVTLSPVADSYVWNGNVGQNYGLTENLNVERVNIVDFTRAFLRFDVSSIPSNATVSSATLTLTPYQFTGAGNLTIELKRLNGAWDEGGVTWANQPAQGDTLTSVYMDDRVEAKTFRITAAVQNWVSAAWANYGFAVVGPEEGSQVYRRAFWSREGAAASAPQLAITYTAPAPAPAPEPSSPPPPPAPSSSPDITMPTIVGVWGDYNSEKGGFNIGVETDEPVTATMDFGTTTNYGTSLSSSGAPQSQNAISFGYKPAGTYHFRIQVRDAAGNSRTTGDFSVATDMKPAIYQGGRLIKLACPAGAGVDHPCRTVFYVGYDAKRHAFPNSKVYFTWFRDFTRVEHVGTTELESLTRGARVRYRGGVRMVKFPTTPMVYVVRRGGRLEGVATEALAQIWYGSDWNRDIDDLPEAFAGDYTLGDTLTSDAYFNPDIEQSWMNMPEDDLYPPKG